jgi:hypothetical protein
MCCAERLHLSTLALHQNYKSNIYKLMKKLFLFFALMSVFTLGMSAQGTSTFTNGYRGFADLGYTIGVGDYEFGRVEVNTTHGYQINPYIFIGAGAGLHFMSSYETPDMDIALDTRDSKVCIPIFAAARVNFTKTKVSPFIDVKGGTFVTSGDGLYLAAAAGCRIATTGKQGLNISLGYTFEKLEFETFGRFTSTHNMNYTRNPRKLDAEGVSIKIGYEF